MIERFNDTFYSSYAASFFYYLAVVFALFLGASEPLTK